MKAAFVYPKEGYLFYENEQSKVKIRVFSDNSKTESAEINMEVTDYRGREIQRCKKSVKLNECGDITVGFVLDLENIGYYEAKFLIVSGEKTINLRTGVGKTTKHIRLSDDSNFGLCTCQSKIVKDIPFFAKLGALYLRVNENEVIEAREAMNEYNLLGTVQIQGRDIFSDSRYASPMQNKVYHYQKQWGKLCPIQEHGNENWEERNTTLRVEWEKTGGLARLSADPSGWYSQSGAAGVDIHKLKVAYDLGLMDYITFISIHAYSFPNAPENTKGFWSIERLVELGEWMQENDINLPVACTEQGYPAMFDQTESESYSPGDMISIEAQSDYLVRSWLIFISLGVSKVLWFNANWYVGFGIMEKDGQAPWPAAMALCQLIRAVDNAVYIGDYVEDEGVYFKVFRDHDGKLFGVVWKPVFCARSCEKENNYTLDGTAVEGDAGIQLLFDYNVPFTEPNICVKDIMGNLMSVSGNCVQIGESPIYIYGLREDITEKLENKTVFKTDKVIPKPLPCPVIIGISDAYPCPGAFVTSTFSPGETREYRFRVHNFSDKKLIDTAEIYSDGSFTISPSVIPVEVQSGMTTEYTVSVKCNLTADCGNYKICSRLRETPAHPVFQLAGVKCPVYIRPVSKPLTDGDSIIIAVKNYSPELCRYVMSIENPEFVFENSVRDVILNGGEERDIAFSVVNCPNVFEPSFNITLHFPQGEEIVYNTTLPIDYIVYEDNASAKSNEKRQKKIISGCDQLMVTGEIREGPALFGEGEPLSLNSTVSIYADEARLYFHFEVEDKILVCVKNQRRDNVDSDGVWISLFKDSDSQQPYRRFCIMPADQLGRTSGCSIKEFSSGILFANPYTDYDFSKCKVSAAITDKGYSIDAQFDLDSIGLDDLPEQLNMQLRVLNMDNDDWPKFYDTGRVCYKVIRKL